MQNLEYDDDEINLARKYVIGEYTETQLNYWIFQNKYEKQKIYDLIEHLQSIKPFFLITKLLLLTFIVYMIMFLYFILTN